MKALSPAEQETLARCRSGIETESPRCIALENRNARNRAIAAKDSNARRQMRVIARALAASPGACGSGSPNPGRMVCGAPAASSTTMAWNGDGWSCVAKVLAASERPEVETGVYSYAFTTDAKLGVYELTAVGCLYGEQGDKPSVETTLVLRGKVGEERVEELPILRRAASR